MLRLNPWTTYRPGLTLGWKKVTLGTSHLAVERVPSVESIHYCHYCTEARYPQKFYLGEMPNLHPIAESYLSFLDFSLRERFTGKKTHILRSNSVPCT